MTPLPRRKSLLSYQTGITQLPPQSREIVCLLFPRSTYVTLVTLVLFSVVSATDTRAKARISESQTCFFRSYRAGAKAVNVATELRSCTMPRATIVFCFSTAPRFFAISSSMDKCSNRSFAKISAWCGSLRSFFFGGGINLSLIRRRNWSRRATTAGAPSLTERTSESTSVVLSVGERVA